MACFSIRLMLQRQRHSEGGRMKAVGKVSATPPRAPGAPPRSPGSSPLSKTPQRLPFRRSRNRNFGSWSSIPHLGPKPFPLLRIYRSRASGFARCEACHDPTLSGQRFSYSCHYERHFPDGGRTVRFDRDILSDPVRGTYRGCGSPLRCAKPRTLEWELRPPFRVMEPMFQAKEPPCCIGRTFWRMGTPTRPSI